jgi:hypothetical protein
MPRVSALATILVPSLLAACNPAETTPAGNGTPSPARAGEASASPAPVTSPGAPIASGEPAPTASPSEGANEPCGASKVRGRWLNALPSADVKAAIADAVGERRIRYYTEGDPITMDYSEERLNVVLGKDGRIKEFRCG